MSLFSKILDKLGLRKDKEEEKVEEKQQPAASGTAGAGASASMPRKPAAASPNPKTNAPARPSGPAPTSERGVRTPASTADRRQSEGMAVKHDPAPVPAAAAAPKPMAAVDVTNMLEQKAKGTGLNWKQSISDLLFLLDIDNSYNARVELAKELNAPQDVMGDSARMNTWLHKEVLRRIAENGGNIPQDLLD